MANDRFEGIHGAMYTINGSSIVVTKRDGKTFYVPKEDWKSISDLMEVEAKLEKLERERKHLLMGGSRWEP